MEQPSDEQQKQLTTGAQRLIKTGYIELSLEDLSRASLMNALAEEMIREELSASEDEEEKGAVVGVMGEKSSVQTNEKTTFVNPPMAMKGMIKMMIMRQDEGRLRGEEKEEKEEKEESRRQDEESR